MKPTEILVNTLDRFIIGGYASNEQPVAVIYDPRVEGGRAAIFLGDDRVERAEAEAQRMRDALPKLRFEVQGAFPGEWIIGGKDIISPASSIQLQFPGLVQHICDWLNEQAN